MLLACHLQKVKMIHPSGFAAAWLMWRDLSVLFKTLYRGIALFINSRLCVQELRLALCADVGDYVCEAVFLSSCGLQFGSNGVFNLITVILGNLCECDLGLLYFS